MWKVIIYIVLVVCISIGCTSDAIFNEVVSIEDESWSATEKIEFTLPINDTSSAFDISIHIRNGTNYQFSNLWLFLSTEGPTGISLVDTVEFFLANPTGEWLGSGLGSVNSMLIPYKSNIRFPNRGIYSFKIGHAMRRQELNGIMDIGIKVEKHTNN